MLTVVLDVRVVAARSQDGERTLILFIVRKGCPPTK